MQLLFYLSAEPGLFEAGGALCLVWATKLKEKYEMSMHLLNSSNHERGLCQPYPGVSSFSLSSVAWSLSLSLFRMPAFGLNLLGLKDSSSSSSSSSLLSSTELDRGLK